MGDFEAQRDSRASCLMKEDRGDVIQGFHFRLCKSFDNFEQRPHDFPMRLICNGRFDEGKYK